MPNVIQFRRFPIALALAGAIVLSAAPKAEFVAAWRDAEQAALIDSAGRIHFFGAQGVTRSVALTANGRPMTWRHAPTSFTRWNSEWLVADGTPQLRRFNASGVFIAVVAVPANFSDLAVAGRTLWAANYLSKSPSTRLWSSSDGRTFTPVPMKDDVEDPLAALFRSHMILAGSPRGDLFLAHLIDAPVVHRFYPPSRRASQSVAYSRSRSRANLQMARSDVEDLAKYSTPVRDMIALTTALVVLRNREDVRLPQGVVTQQGIRADQYDAEGRHTASAVFPEPMKWILRSDARHVTAVTTGGVVRVGRWGKPIAGGIVR